MENLEWIAYCNYAPYGDWGRAMEAKLGDYSNFDYEFNIN